MSKQFPAFEIVRLILVRSKENIAAVGERFGVDSMSGMSGAVIAMDANVLEVVTELSFEESTLGLWQRVTAALRR